MSEPRSAAALRSALFGECPQCSARTLFANEGILSAAQFAPRCRSCGLDLDRFNVGDGPAAFLTLIIGAVVVGLAMWLELSLAPPLWVHALIWIPFTAAAVLGGLRVAKAMLLRAEFANRAGEAGREQ